MWGFIFDLTFILTILTLTISISVVTYPQFSVCKTKLLTSRLPYYLGTISQAAQMFQNLSIRGDAYLRNWETPLIIITSHFCLTSTKFDLTMTWLSKFHAIELKINIKFPISAGRSTLSTATSAASAKKTNGGLKGSRDGPSNAIEDSKEIKSTFQNHHFA